MAVEIATLGLGIQNVTATADANAAALEKMGEKGEEAQRKIAGSSNPVTAAIKQQAIDYTQLTARATDFARAGATAAQVAQMTGVSMAQAAAAVKAYAGTVSKAQIDVDGLKAAQAQLELANISVGKSVVVAGNAIKSSAFPVARLREGLASAVAQMTGLPPVVTRIVSTLGVMSVGMTQVVTGLAAIGAAAWVYDKLTEGSRKAMETADKLAESYNRLARVAALGIGGQQRSDIEEINKGLEQHNKWLGFIIAARVRLGSMVGLLGPDPGGHGAAITAGTSAAAVAEQQRVNAIGLQMAKDNEAWAARLEDEADKAKAAADKLRAAREKDAAEEMGLQQKVAALRLKQTLDELKQIAEVQAVRRDVINERIEQEEAFAQKRADDEDRITKNLVREMQQTWSKFFSDTLSNGLSSFRDLFDGIKKLFFKLIADMLAAGVMRRMAGVFGGLAAGTGGGAGSGGMLGGLGAQMLGQAAMGGVAGGLVGYGVGGMVGGRAGGAVAGAATGAAAGFMVAGPLGALAGGVTGLIGGFLGGAAAAREAAAAMRQMQKDYVAAVAAFKHDDLGAALAQNAAQAETLRKLLLDSLGGLLSILLRGVDSINAYKKALAEINAQEIKNAEILKRQSVYAQEDLVVRNLRATGQGGAADVMAFQNAQSREMQKAIDENRDATYLSYLATVQNNELIAFQNGLLSDALRNSPSGFRIDPYTYAFQTPRGPSDYPTDGGLPPGYGGPVNPVGPTGGAPPLSRVTLVFQPGSLVVDKDGMMNVVLDKIDQTAGATNGSGSSRSAALDGMRRR